MNKKKYYRYRIKTIGIDLDMPDEWYKERTIERLEKLRDADIIKFWIVERSRHGWHIKAVLCRVVNFQRSIELRHFLFDDSLRIVKDIIKYWKGAEEFDLLFTKKWKGWE